MLARGKELAQAQRDLLSLEEETAHAAAESRLQRKEIRAAMEVLSREVLSEETLREVEFVEVPDHDTNAVNIIRTDTMEVVDTRAMTAEERQGDLLLVTQSPDEAA